MFKIEKNPFLWAFITFIGVEAGFMIIDKSYFAKFQNNVLLSLFLLLIKLFIFIGLALIYKHFKMRKDKQLK